MPPLRCAHRDVSHATPRPFSPRKHTLIGGVPRLVPQGKRGRPPEPRTATLRRGTERRARHVGTRGPAAPPPPGSLDAAAALSGRRRRPGSPAPDLPRDPYEARLFRDTKEEGVCRGRGGEKGPWSLHRPFTLPSARTSGTSDPSASSPQPPQAHSCLRAPALPSPAPFPPAVTPPDPTPRPLSGKGRLAAPPGEGAPWGWVGKGWSSCFPDPSCQPQPLASTSLRPSVRHPRPLPRRGAKESAGLLPFEGGRLRSDSGEDLGPPKPKQWIADVKRGKEGVAGVGEAPGPGASTVRATCAAAPSLVPRRRGGRPRPAEASATRLG